jgi:hypothetical protein
MFALPSPHSYLSQTSPGAVAPPSPYRRGIKEVGKLPEGEKMKEGSQLPDPG